MDNIEAPLLVHPGEWFFGRAPSRVSTLLGSCVAITLWHPSLRWGGLCHYLLPRPPGHVAQGQPDTRYGTYALSYLRHQAERYAPLREYEIGCFGGSDMFSDKAPSRVGEINVEFAVQWLHRHHLSPSRQNLCGCYSRNILLDLANGHITLKRYPIASAPEIPQ